MNLYLVAFAATLVGGVIGFILHRGQSKKLSDDLDTKHKALILEAKDEALKIKEKAVTLPSK